jgi:hypothetical protein
VPAFLDRGSADGQVHDLAVRRVAATLPDGGYVIATAVLRVPGGAVAHRPGDRVPTGNITPNGWQDLVRPPADGE